MTYVCSMIAIAQLLPQIPQTNVSLLCRRYTCNTETFLPWPLCHEAFVQYTAARTCISSKRTSRSRQNGPQFTDAIFKLFFVEFLSKFHWMVQSITVVRPALVQVMAWCRTFDKPLSQCSHSSYLTYAYICVTRPRWVNIWTCWFQLKTKKVTSVCRAGSKFKRPFLIWLHMTALIHHIQSSAVITRYDIVRYYINNHRKWGRISIRCWIYTRHVIPRPNGWAMECLLWIFVRKLTAF